MKTISFDEIKDNYIGKIGSSERESYELELQLELIGQAIKDIRKKRNLTQEDLGKLIGVSKSQISKLETNRKNITIDTLIRVFNAMKAKVELNIELV